MYQLYKLIAPAKKAQAMRSQLEAGGYGWGHAKKDLLEGILERFSEERERYNHFMNHPKEVEEQLLAGAAKAKIVAHATIERVREKLGM